MLMFGRKLFFWCNYVIVIPFKFKIGNNKLYYECIDGKEKRPLYCQHSIIELNSVSLFDNFNLIIMPIKMSVFNSFIGCTGICFNFQPCIT